MGGSAKNTEGIPYGIVDGTSTSTSFTATVAGITELKDGTVVILKNGVISSASGCKLNVNGLGAKPIYASMSAASAVSTQFNVNYTAMFVYDSTRVTGGAWIMYYGYYASSSNSIGYQIRLYTAVLPAASKFYRYRLLFMSADSTKWIPANTSTSTSETAAKTVNTAKINPFGKIAYYNTTTAIEANANVPVGNAWLQYNLNLGYSFNTTGAAWTLTYPAPVYLKCTPQSDGSAIMDGITQTLPSTEDSKIYIMLGLAYSATQIELTYDHPVYYYKDSQIRLWTNAASSGGGGISDVTVDGTSVVTGGVAEIDLTGKSDVGHTHVVSNITDFPTIPGPATTGTPADLGTASNGSADTYARSDHVHSNVVPTDVDIKSSNLEDGDTPGSSVFGNGFNFKDANDYKLIQVYPFISTSGIVEGGTVSARRNIGGTDYSHYATMGVTDDGSPYVYLSEKSAWIKALGYGTETTSTNIVTPSSNITISDISLTYCGGMAQVYIQFKYSSAISTSAVSVCTFKSPYQPAESTPIISTSGNVVGYISSSDGKMSVTRAAAMTSNISANTSVTMRAVFIRKL